ncbi:ABC transporter ATP-binding protein [Diaminobutyricibacter tongyongensis]|uniref:ABC transporter ATP-binding protein n=1 Tax=Leifsonia tongyongensis TaxID=1268043 RepID=A0A6L9Y1I8_9MICO|nr:ABC transporter ATP-binding protein [Diaminobutyricibacter tongyongensis]NEN07549.1 ABC transporter ATP-binding protein [Diaminobutyricibacter tongyongensis]
MNEFPSAPPDSAPSPDGAAIRLVGVSKSYGGVEAIRSLDLDLARGESVALLGPNGAGKSTTIGMMVGLVTADRGRVQVAGTSPRTAVARGAIAAMLQDTGFMGGVTVAELVGFAASIYPRSLAVGRAIDLAGLIGLERRRVDRLSGGQAQRLRFAIAVVADPEILILDEPTRALDVQARAEFWEAMRAFAATGRTLVFATHYLDEVDGNASRVVVLANGSIVGDGRPDEIRRRTGTTMVRVSVADTGFDSQRRLEELAGVAEIARSGERFSLRTTDADATVRELALSGLSWRALEVAPPSLDESFLTLTQEAS